MSDRPVLFLAFANDQEDRSRYLRGLAAELRSIRQALQPARQAQALEIVERANATLGDILDVFQDSDYSGRIRLFHYGGHADSYQLLLETEGGGPQAAFSEGLNRFLARQPGLQAVFLNGCSTREQARDLREAGVPAVVATSRAIQDEQAVRFATRFYKGLAGNASLEKSFRDAVDELMIPLEGSGFRSLYLPEEGSDQEPPWMLLPDPPPAWRLGGSPPPATLAPGELQIGKYAHLLCNRYQQNDEFATAHVRNSGRLPRIYLIHGHRDERHDSLVSRFSYSYIGRKKQYLQPVDAGTWPFGGDGETLLRVRLAEQFDELNRMGKPASLIAGRDLVSASAAWGREAVVVQHRLPAEEWNSGTAQLLRWYAGEFWRMDQVPAEAPQWVIFINILYSDQVREGGLFSRLLSSRASKGKIQSELESIARDLPASCTLLSELENVKPSHVEDWLLQTRLGGLEESLNLVERIFSEGGKRLEAAVMDRIELGLKQLIRSLHEKYTVQWV